MRLTLGSCGRTFLCFRDPATHVCIAQKGGVIATSCYGYCGSYSNVVTFMYVNAV
jgi:hypothetical protein